MPTRSGSNLVTAIWTLAGIALAGVVLGLTLNENGHNAWHTVHAWGVLPIAGAALTAAPALSAGNGLTPRRAWQLSVAGAVLLVLFWILLVLPDVGSNTTLLTTVGTAAGVLCAWIAPTGAPTDGRSGPPPGPVW